MGGSKPRRVIAFQLGTLQLALTIVVLLITIAGAVYAGIVKVGELHSEITIRPIIESCVRKEVAQAVTQAVAQAQHAQDKRLSSIEVAVRGIQVDTKRNTVLLEQLLSDRLRENGR